MEFRNYIRKIARSKKSILEIGPSYNPIVPKHQGFNVRVMDHASAQDLRKKYGSYGIDTSKIEDVDFVTTDLSSLKKRGESFDLIIASHVIEHSTDLIEFVNGCDDLLTNDGQIALLIPDKRYCFDIYRPLSTAGAAIDAHLTKRKKHLGALFDHYSYFSTLNGNMAWGKYDTGSVKTIHTAEQCLEAFSKSNDGSDYVDAHEWVFTPTSFKLVLNDLRDSKFVNVGITFQYPTIGYEFLCILSRNAPIVNVPRLNILNAIREEELSFTEISDDIQHPEDKSIKHEPDVQAMRRELAEIIRRNGLLASSLSEIQSSTSWRITGPLRTIGRLRLRLRRKLRID